MDHHTTGATGTTSTLDSYGTFDGHRAPVAALAPTPDGQILTAGYDGGVALADPRTGTFTALGFHRHLATCVAVNASGTLAASGSADYTAKVWDLATRREVCAIAAHTDDIEAVAFTDNGYLATAGRDHRVLLHDPLTGALVTELAGHDKDVIALAAAGEVLMSVGDDRVVRLWNVPSGVAAGQWGPFPDETDCCALDPVRRHAAFGCDDGRVRVLDLTTRNVRTMEGTHSSGVKTVVFAPSGELHSLAYDQRLITHDPVSGRTVGTRMVPAGIWERSLRVTSSGVSVAGTFDGTVQVFDGEAHAAREIGRPGGRPCLNDMAVSDGGQHVAVAADDGRVRLLDLDPRGDVVSVRTGATGPRHLANAVAVTGDGNTVIAGTHDGQLHTFHVTDRDLVPMGSTSLAAGPVNTIAVTPRGYLVGTYSGLVVEVDRSLHHMGRHQVHDAPVKSLRVTATGEMVSCAADGAVHAGRINDLSISCVLRRGGAIANDVALNLAGTAAAVVGRDFTVRTFDLASGRTLESRRIGNRSLRSVAYLTDDIVAVGDYWGAVHLVRPDHRVVTLDVTSNGISGLTRTSPGIALAVSYNGTIHAITAAGSRRIVAFQVQRPGGDACRLAVNTPQEAA